MNVERFIAGFLDMSVCVCVIRASAVVYHHHSRVQFMMVTTRSLWSASLSASSGFFSEHPKSAVYRTCLTAAGPSAPDRRSSRSNGL